jgi:hypothetical protein
LAVVCKRPLGWQLPLWQLFVKDHWAGGCSFGTLFAIACMYFIGSIIVFLLQISIVVFMLARRNSMHMSFNGQEHMYISIDLLHVL